MVVLLVDPNKLHKHPMLEITGYGIFIVEDNLFYKKELLMILM